MRNYEGGTAHLARMIEADLKKRSTGLYKPHIKGVSDLVASVLTCRNVNSSEWIAVLPRKNCDSKSIERYISRLLSNSQIDPIKVMGGFVPEIIKAAGSQGKTVVMMLDQSNISKGFECLMVSLRFGERAIPVAWCVVETEGSIGFDIQELLLKSVAGMIPEGIDILLSGDRFYGTSALIGWCQQQGWKYRVRLKRNLKLLHEGGEVTTGQAASLELSALLNAKLAEVITHIGILHEEGHKEPWIIAMSEAPTKGRILDYGMRWGIEAMFSDFKTRGFGITRTHLKHTDRIERLILILAIATYWAVSTGMKPIDFPRHYTQKKSKEVSRLILRKGSDSC